MGIGRLVGNRFNLVVSLRHNADANRLAEWKASFERASALLFDATDGQHEFGEILVCNNSSGGRNADAWLLEPEGLSLSDVSGLGTPSGHMTLCGDERFKPAVIVQQFAPYAYGLYDEYSGPGRMPAECIGGTTSDACIMEASWPDGDRFGDDGTGGPLVTGRISEFCVADNHDPDRNTNQEHAHGQSCWETIVHAFPAMTAPIPKPDASAGSASGIDWVVLADEQRFALVVDRSGSMDGNKLLETKIGADWWADHARRNDRLSIVSFADTASADFPLAPIRNDADRTQVKAAVADIAAGGQTSIGGGLRAGLEQIQRPGGRATVQVLILLTDGLQNAGEDPSTVLPDLIAAGVRVYTIAVGPSVDTKLLEHIARSTGGTPDRVPPNESTALQEFHIRTTLQQISGIAHDNSGIVTTQSTPFIDGQAPAARTVLLEPGSTLATFATSWLEQDVSLGLELVSPEGEPISSGNVPSGVREISGDRPYMGFEIENPSPGKWQVALVSNQGPISTEAHLFAFSEQPQIDGSLVVPDRDYRPGDTVPLSLQVYFDQPLTNLRVSGIAHLPHGGLSPLRFDDEGNHLFGDIVANDGVYSALFDETHRDQGTYTFRVDIESDGSVEYAAAGEPLLPGESFNRDPIPPFRRTFTTAVVVGDEPIEGGSD